MKFFAAIKQAEFAAKLFAAAGLDLETILAAGDVNALKAHIDALKPSADVTVIEANLAVASQKAETLEAALASAKSDNDELTAKLSKAESDAKVSDDKIALKAREVLAKNDVSVPIATAPSVDATKPSSEGKKSMTHSEFSALTPSQKMQFCLGGGKITEMPV